jgi:glutamate carboxypeptidase
MHIAPAIIFHLKECPVKFWQTNGVFDGMRPAMMSRISELVCLESPSASKPALDALAAVLANRLHELGASVETVANDRGGDHVLGRFHVPSERRPALVLAHFDTVWPLGTLNNMPFRVDLEGRAFGPGIFDMKASLAIFLAVMEELMGHRHDWPRPIWALFTSDEELGSPRSRELIERLAIDCAYVLVLEPAMADGGLKTARKGVGRFHLDIEGKAAHSGVAPQEGRSAILELTRQILRIHDLQDLASGTTINVGVVAGGTTVNVVPAHASAEIDVRAVSRSEAVRVESALRSLSPVVSDNRLTLSGSFNRPPMERTPASASLFEEARLLVRKTFAGAELTEGSTGGGSDGNFTAALGVATLDGLGARGAGAHADNEHILIDSLPERASLLHLLLMHLKAQS